MAAQWVADIEHRGTGDCVYSQPCVSQAWWYTSAVLARRRQEYQKFRIILGYILSSGLA